LPELEEGEISDVMCTVLADGRLVRCRGVETFAFDARSLRQVRRVVTERAAGEGLAPETTSDLALAVHELAANSVRHGGGTGVLRLWAGDGDVHCEVEDHGDGVVEDRDAGCVPPATDAGSGRGLWLARQLCDDVDITSTRSGTIVRVHVHVDA
jgi:anti-sigma regulatory factor (Ser/Thr protein kinase)